MNERKQICGGTPTSTDRERSVLANNVNLLPSLGVLKLGTNAPSSATSCILQLSDSPQCRLYNRTQRNHMLKRDQASTSFSQSSRVLEHIRALNF